MPLQEDGHGNPIANSDKEQITIGGCFLHDMTTDLLKGFAGTGINPRYYIVANRTDNILVGDSIKVMEGDQLRGEGQVLHTTRTSLHGNYIKIFI